MTTAIDGSLRVISQQMQAMTGVSSGAAAVQAPTADFSSVLKTSLEKISGDQQHAASEAQAFELGSPNVSLSDVMIDTQKANIGLQFGLQVRNRVVAAYNEIMQMPV